MAHDRKHQRFNGSYRDRENTGANTPYSYGAASQRHRPAEVTKDRGRDHGAATANMANPTATSTSIQRQFLEVNYMGTTRAVVGHGFHVRELLFGDDFVSLRITVPISAADKLRIFCASVVAYQVAQGLVDHAEMDATLATKGATTTEASMTVHLSSKRCALPFMKCVDTLRTTVDGLVVEPLRTNPSPVIAQPVTFTDVSRTGHVDVKWATGVATGRAELHFATAGAANSFLRGYYMKKLELPPVEIVLMGMSSDKERSQLLPYKRVYLDLVPPLAVNMFDEAKISEMTPTQVDKFHFLAMIESGLPLHVDEAMLIEMVHPHTAFMVKIQRDGPVDPVTLQEDAITAHQNSFLRRTQPLLSCLAADEEPVALNDNDTKQMGLRVNSSDVQRLAQICAEARLASLWSQLDQPYGQPVRVSVQYVYRALLKMNVYQCFCDQLAQVRFFARSNGVECPRFKNTINNRAVEIVLRSSALDALERVVQSMEKAIEWQEYGGADFLAVCANRQQYRDLKEWVASVNQMKASEVCVFINSKASMVQIYGGKSAREQELRNLRALCRMLCFCDPKPQSRVRCSACRIPTGECLVKMMTCNHTCCLSCIQRHIATSKQLPLQCPVCGSSIHVSDIAKLADDMDAFSRMAVLDFVASHPNEYPVCPQQGCDQVLSRTPTASTQRKSGGDFAWCGSCNHSYCLPCSDALRVPAETHAGVSCEEQQAAISLAADWHVKCVRDLLSTLRCPRCRTAVHHFDGSITVLCSYVPCNHFFCAVCVGLCASDVVVVHDHVLQCAKNPEPGSHTISPVDLTAAHREYRQVPVQAYFETQIQDSATRRYVLKRLAKDLLDAGICIDY